MNEIKCIAGESLSVGYAVTCIGTKLIYSGKLLKPLTWFKFEKVQIVVPDKIDNIAIFKE